MPIALSTTGRAGGVRLLHKVGLIDLMQKSNRPYATTLTEKTLCYLKKMFRKNETQIALSNATSTILYRYFMKCVRPHCMI